MQEWERFRPCKVINNSIDKHQEVNALDLPLLNPGGRIHLILVVQDIMVAKTLNKQSLSSQTHPEKYWGYVNQVGERACYDEGTMC